MTENKDPTKEQKAAAYDKFMAWTKDSDNALRPPLAVFTDRLYAALLKNFAMEEPRND